MDDEHELNQERGEVWKCRNVEVENEIGEDSNHNSI